MMKKGLVLFLSLSILFLICASFIKHINGSYVNVNKLVKADWANEGSWIFLNDPNNKDLDRLFIMEISFSMNGQKEFFHGREKAYLVDEFLRAVNNKYTRKIKLLRYKRSFIRLILMYEDGTKIIWDFMKKRTTYK